MMEDTRRGEEGSGGVRGCRRSRDGPDRRRGGVAPGGGGVVLPRHLALPGPRLLLAQQRGDAGAQLLGRAALAPSDAGEHLLERGGVAQAGIAALAALEVGADLLGAPFCELAVQVLEDAGERLAAADLTHGLPGRTYPSSTAYLYSSLWSRRRPRNSRLFTVPVGIPSTAAISA